MKIKVNGNLVVDTFDAKTHIYKNDFTVTICTDEIEKVKAMHHANDMAALIKYVECVGAKDVAHRLNSGNAADFVEFCDSGEVLNIHAIAAIRYTCMKDPEVIMEEGDVDA